MAVYVTILAKCLNTQSTYLQKLEQFRKEVLSLNMQSIGAEYRI